MGGRDDEIRQAMAREVAAVKAAVRIEDIAGQLTTLKRAGRELRGLSPFKAERTPSFYVEPRKQSFYCFCTSAGGDVFDLVMMARNCGFAEALAYLKDVGRVPDDPAKRAALAARHVARAAELARQERAEAARKAATAHEIAAASTAIWGTPAETYLEARGIDVAALLDAYGDRALASLRYHPALDYYYEGVRHRGPAMVGLVTTGPDLATVTGIHRTWLLPDGSAKARLPKAKLTLGVIHGSGGYLTPARDVAVMGEGYETTLSVVAALAKRGTRVMGVSALSLPNMAGAGLPDGKRAPHPDRRGERLPTTEPDHARPGLLLPAGTKRCILLADNDGKDPASTMAMTRRAQTKLIAAGVRTTIAVPPAGCDFNDMVRP